MKTKIKFILLLLLTQNWIIGPVAFAQNSNIIISEIAAYQTSDHEWIEIYNRGTDPVDLTGWKFYEDKTKHGLSAYQGDLIVDAGEYAIIADVAANFKTDYPDFTGTIIDSAWTTLNLDGEEIGLINNAGETVELFTYLPCPTTSLQKVDLILDDYSAPNWQIHATADSAGAANEFISSEPENSDNNDNASNPPPTDVNDINDYTPIQDNDYTDITTDEDNDYTNISETEDQNNSSDFESSNTSSNTQTQTNYYIAAAGDILINEIMPAPADGNPEWVELFNASSQTINLDDWYLQDGSNYKHYLSGNFNSQTFLVVENPKCRLNNTGDLLKIVTGSGAVIDQLTYGSWNDGNLADNWPAPDEGQTLARINQIFEITESPTPGQINIIVGPQNDNSIAENSSPTETISTAAPSAGTIIISELFPNPINSDTEEWIELKNLSNFDIDLTGYKLIDKENTVYKFKAGDFSTNSIKANSCFLIPKSVSGMTLNNIETETIKLYDPKNKLIDKVSTKADFPAGLAWAKDNNEFVFSAQPTPGAENIIQTPNWPPVLISNCPKTGLTNEKIICDLSDSYDIGGEKLNYSWQIGEQIFDGEILEYEFESAGTFDIKSMIKDAQIQIEKIQTIKITEPKNSNEKSAQNTAAENTADPEYSAAEIADLSEADKGKKITTVGILTVLPQLFGAKIAYLDGLQLALNKGNWPPLKTNDLIQVSGTISTAAGPLKLNLAAETIYLLDQNQSINGVKLNISEINDNYLNYLISVSGQILEKTKTQIILVQDSQELIVTAKKNTQINFNDLAEGQEVKITGVLGQNSKGEFTLFPRFASDIEKIQSVSQKIIEATTAPAQAAPINLPANDTNGAVMKYLVISGVGAAVALGWILIKKFKVQSSKCKV